MTILVRKSQVFQEAQIKRPFVRNTEIDLILKNIQAVSDSEVMKALADDESG